MDSGRVQWRPILVIQGENGALSILPATRMPALVLSLTQMALHTMCL